MRAWAVCIIVCIAAGVACDDILGPLDEFDADQGTFVISSPGGDYSTSVASSGILGGYRTLDYSVHSDVYTSDFSISVSGGHLRVTSPPLIQPTRGLWVTWNGEADNKRGPEDFNPSGLGGMDLAGVGYNAFLIRMKAAYSTNATMSVYSSSLDDYCTVNFPMPASNDLVDVNVLFSSFVAVGNGCDFSNVGAIQFHVPTTSNLDYDVDYVRLHGDDSIVDNDDCQVTLYTGGDQCKALDALACSSCSVGPVEDFYRFNCTKSADGCQCYQYLYSSSGCSGTPLITQVPSQPCAQLTGSFPAQSVCYATVQEKHAYQVNFYSNDPGVTEGQCARQDSVSCMACTAGGLTNYYSAACDSYAAPGSYPCVLQMYASSDSTCSSDAVEVPMAELTCEELSTRYEGDAACAFSFEQK